MKKKILKSYSEYVQNRHRANNLKWLVIHADGEYEYRSPDSVYVHRYDIFDSKEKALYFLSNHITPVEREEWRLYQEVPVDWSSI